MANRDSVMCWACVSDPVLREWIRKRASLGTCSFCGRRRRVCELLAVAEEVDRVIRQHYVPAGDSPHVVDWSDNIEYWADGESATDIIAEIAGIEPDIAEARL